MKIIIYLLLIFSDVYADVILRECSPGQCIDTTISRGDTNPIVSHRSDTTIIFTTSNNNRR